VTKQYYMACLDLEGRRCVVVGGGAVAAEKVAGLLTCAARVTVVAPELHDDLREAPIQWRRRGYRATDLAGAFLVIAATDDRSVNERVHHDAEARGLLCNVADVPELCNFILPAIFRRDPITVAVSTGGASPALAKRLRDRIGELVEPRHAELALRLQALRPWAKTELAGYAERRSYFEQLLDAEL
jgi:precorrin-2 dehydrogenase / sirohydrochlorin ferrochelatase